MRCVVGLNLECGQESVLLREERFVVGRAQAADDPHPEGHVVDDTFVAPCAVAAATFSEGWDRPMGRRARRQVRSPASTVMDLALPSPGFGASGS